MGLERYRSRFHVPSPRTRVQCQHASLHDQSHRLLLRFCRPHRHRQRHIFSCDSFWNGPSFDGKLHVSFEVFLKLCLKCFSLLNGFNHGHRNDFFQGVKSG